MANTWNNQQDDIGLRLKQPEQTQQTLGGLPSLPQVNGSAPAAQSGALGNTGNSGNTGTLTKTNNGYGMRNLMTGGGIGNSSIDWNSNNGMVTLNGNDFYKPDRVVDGVSYVDDPTKVLNAMGQMGGKEMQAAIKAYGNFGKNIVQASDYMANNGVNFDVDWDGSNVLIGGVPVDYAFISPDGKAYVDRTVLDKAISKMQKISGVQNEADILQKYNDKYSDRIANMIDKTENRKAFTYDPLSDPAYEAYRDMYLREGDRAMRDAMGAAQAASGGYMNSAAAIAAAQQNNYYTQQLNDRVPELMQFAYQRYADDFDRNRQVLADLKGLREDEFNREYGVNSDIINRINYNNQLNTARDDKTYERYRDEQESDRKWEYDNKLLEDQLKNSEANRSSIERANRAQDMAQCLELAQRNDKWPANAAELGFDTSVSPYAYDQRMLDMEVEKYRKQLQIEKDMYRY